MNPKRLIIALAAVVTFAGCASGQQNPTDPTTGVQVPTLSALVPSGDVHFVVLGDTGMGNDAQKKVSAAVESVCRVKGCTFAIIAGDNIYPVGVRNEFDPQFISKFEEPYANLDIPFYLVLGNHDNGDGDGGIPDVGDHEVRYSERTDRVSNKWNMPGRYYSFSYGDVTVIGIDSGPAEVSQANIWIPGTRGPVMQQWLAAEVAKTTTKWKFAFAHHPYISNSIHGDAGIFDNSPGRGLSYKLMLEDTICDNVQLFFSGHDHNLQWLRPVDACGSTEFIVSGAGGASIYAKGAAPESPAYFEDYQNHGFFLIQVSGNELTGTAYDDEGTALFERSFTI
jgi:tartrate-resistant acid phosphatase type 5